MKVHLKGPDDYKISACTIAKNEGKNIAKSINSYKKYADEIIVVDTGSTDNTAEIAEVLGAKVIHFKWCNDFAAAKNAGIDAACGDWIICLDADEYFAGNTAKNIRKAVAEADREGKTAIGCRMEHINSKTGETFSEGFSLRIIKAGMRYRYAVHEEIYGPAGIHIITVNKSWFYLKHTGYSPEKFVGKCERNLSLLLKEIETITDDFRRVTYYSYIADTYFGLKIYDKAIEYSKKFIDESESMNLRIIGCDTKPYLNIIESLENMQAEPDKITPYTAKFLKKYPECPDAHLAAGRDYLRRFMFDKAVREFLTAVKMSENYDGVYIESVSSHIASVYKMCGLCFESLHEPSQAMDFYFRAVKEKNEYQQALSSLLRVVHSMPEKETDAFLASLYDGKSEERKIALLSALMSNYMTDHLIRFYALYRSQTSKTTLESDVTAFIMAGRGNYGKAAEFFYLNYTSNKSDYILYRCALFAQLGNNTEITGKAAKLLNPVARFVLGYGKKPELKDDDFKNIAFYLAEYKNAGLPDIAVEKLRLMNKELNSGESLKIARLLALDMFYTACMEALKNADISAESVFIRGYCMFGVRRFYESSELLLLARSMGMPAEPVNEIYNRIELLKGTAGGGIDKGNLIKLKDKIIGEVESGEIESAAADIREYKKSAEPDLEILTADAMILYYIGEYNTAAIAAECGLLKDENNCDLLYNAGCIYQKLGNKKRAADMYKRAEKNCTDNAFLAEIKQSFNTL